MKEIVHMAKTGLGVGGEAFQDKDLGEIQERIDTTSEELTEDDLMEIRASKPVPDNEEGDVGEALPDNKLMLDNLAEGFQLVKTGFYFFYNMDPFMIQTLKLKQMLEERLVPYRNIFRELKKQKRQTEMMMNFRQVPPPPPLLPLPP